MGAIARVIFYLVCSVFGVVIVADVAGFAGFSGRGADFATYFWFYAAPLPFLGMFHLPMQAIGVVVCLLLTPQRSRRFMPWLGGALIAALLIQGAARVAGFEDHWFVFAYVTVDLILLVLMSAAQLLARRAQAS